jgi:Bacterial regulatory helix-turn-helix protein, lysR family
VDYLSAMEAFVRVIDTGSFSGAARQLRLGQPAISKAIAQLEECLGGRLVLHSTHRLTPTESGQNFYEHARRAIEESVHSTVEYEPPPLQTLHETECSRESGRHNSVNRSNDSGPRPRAPIGRARFPTKQAWDAAVDMPGFRIGGTLRRRGARDSLAV